MGTPELLDRVSHLRRRQWRSDRDAALGLAAEPLSRCAAAGLKLDSEGHPVCRRKAAYPLGITILPCSARPHQGSNSQGNSMLAPMECPCATTAHHPFTCASGRPALPSNRRASFCLSWLQGG